MYSLGPFSGINRRDLRTYSRVQCDYCHYKAGLERQKTQNSPIGRFKIKKITEGFEYFNKKLLIEHDISEKEPFPMADPGHCTEQVDSQIRNSLMRTALPDGSWLPSNKVSIGKNKEKTENHEFI